jgi:hypothetical protein
VVTITAVSHADRVQALAAEYERDGYVVKVQPRGGELPDFLQEFCPDILAIGPNDRVVVEIRNPGKLRRKQYWRDEEQAAIAGGWKFRTVQNGQSKSLTLDSLDEAEIRSRVLKSRALMSQHEAQAAWLLLSSATEAALRSLAAGEDVVVYNETPSAVASALYSDGLIDRSDYNALVAFFDQRDMLVHGYQEAPAHPELFVQASDLTIRLLDESSGHPS